MTDQERMKLAGSIAGKIVKDLMGRKGLDEIFRDEGLMLRAHWTNVIFSMLPDGLTGTSPRDRLPANYVDNLTSTPPPPPQILEDL